MAPPTKVILVAPSFLASFHVAMFQALRGRFEPGDLVLRGLTDSSFTQAQRFMALLGENDLAAVIAVSVRPSPEVVDAFRARRLPLVLVDEDAPLLPSVTIDNVAGGRLATHHLIQQGRRNIALVSGATGRRGSHAADQRQEGFLETLRACRLTVPQGATIQAPRYSREDGLSILPHLLKTGVDGVFCAAGDSCALGLLAAVARTTVRVPQDLSIVGYDDLPVAENARPPLTTVRQPIKRMAQAAYKLAVIERSLPSEVATRVVFPPELVVRSSA